MSMRRRALAEGWYPGTRGEIEEWLAVWDKKAGGPVPATAGKGALAAVAPHAGWYFSGELAWRAVASLRAAETVVVVGGHLPGTSPFLLAPEESFETPLGILAVDPELRRALMARLAARGAGKAAEDRAGDNTVEIQLPLVAARFPRARLLWLRAPNGPAALLLGAALAEAAAELGRAIVVLGSTDLTHYGPAYGFEPKGRGIAAERWVKEENDRAFLEALLAQDAEKALALGEATGAACSAGAAAAALAFALAAGAGGARLLGYATSLERRRDPSFVGYGALAFGD